MSKITKNYYVSFPKREIILGADLQWKNFSELKAGGVNPVLFNAEADVALTAAQWFSQNGITASSYTESGIIKLATEKIGETPVLLGDVISERMMNAYVREGIYPKELIRKPLSRTDKIHFMNLVTCGSAWGHARKEQEDSDGSQYLIVDTKDRKVMSNNLQWIDVEDIHNEPDMAKNILTFCGSATRVQDLAAWFRKSGMFISPYSTKTAATKLNLNPDALENNSFSRLIREGVLPQKLNRKAINAKEISEFQADVEKGIALLPPPESKAAVPIPVPQPTADTQKAETDLPQIGMADDDSIIAVAPVSSPLVEEILGTAASFKDLLTASSQLLSKKREELRKMDGILLDMDHLIEFYDLNAADGFGMYKKRQSIRRERRALKDEIFALDLVVDKLSKGVTIENLDCFIKSVQNLYKRQYRLRALSKEDVVKYVHSKKALCGICSES